MNQKNSMRKYTGIAAMILAVGALTGAGTGYAQTFTPLSSQLSFGSRGNDVRTLQTFLATDKFTYPEGLVTGYYGRLTQEAVVQFQLSYNIPAVGRVGPMTRAKINEMIAAGKNPDTVAPAIFDITTTSASSTATVSWKTDEPTTGKVFFDTKAIIALEATRPQTELTISGTMAQDTTSTTGKQVTLTGLSGKTTYFYVIEAIDRSNNVSITTERTFVTP